MSHESIGEKAGNKLEEGLGQVKSGVMGLAARAGIGSHDGDADRTKTQLYAEAKRLGIKGRSKMTKAELERAVRKA